ncbi:hypothetical protein GCM10028805_54870 [Spirosoma harenae]
MKINGLLGLFATGIALASLTTYAQTTPTGTVTSTTIPQGAIAPDSTPAKPDRSQKRAMRQNRRQMNQNARTANGTTNTTPQDAQYRQSSASDGTTINNSNTTNYNSNNVTNAPTGAGSNPNTQNSTTPSMPADGQTKVSEATSNAGTVEAIKGAKTTESPAIKAGSTTRNTSVGDFVSSSPNYTMLQNALQSADLFETLKGTGPYTLFAPTNAAFKKLPTAVQGGLLDGSNRDALKQLLSYHVISGSLSANELTQKIKGGNGKAELKTLSGATLTASETNGQISLMDERGNTVRVDPTGDRQANGMVYSIETILMPKTGASFR